MKKQICFVFTLLMLACTSAIGQDQVIIVNAEVSDEMLNASFIEKVYLGKKTRWSDGTKIVPLALKKGDVHENFLKAWVNKTPSQFSNFWKKQIFTGRGIPPKAYADEADLVKKVAETKGAIGYVSQAVASAEGVRVVKVE